MITPLEPIEVLNARLIDRYGKFEDGRANWRVVFSDEQFEHRFDTFVDRNTAGNVLREFRGIRLVPKYPFMPHQYVLERLLPVPEQNALELTTTTSYEPVWGFTDQHGNPLPPRWEAIEFVIKT